MMASIVHIQSQFSLVSILFLNLVLATKINDVSFSIDLIHRDSPDSPLYNPHQTMLARFKNAFQGSTIGLNHFCMTSFNPNVPQIEVSAENGQYLMKFSIGTPPVDTYGLVDTGSDLMWTQCLPCQQCYKQKNPIYNPKASSSYTDISCKSQQCHLLDTTSCSPTQLCNYTYGYGGGALTQGGLASEIIALGSSSGQLISFKNIIFGCGHNNSGFNKNEMGLVGLGRGPTSLISQIGSNLGSKKFSYCLVPFHTDPRITSKMYLGPGSEVSGSGVVSTPLVSKQDPTYYFVTLEGISVGNKYVPFNSSKVVSKGNMFIDSGTPPMILPKDFYSRLEEEVKNAIQLEPYKDPELGTQLCYKSKSIIKAPTLIAHFDGAGEVPLVPTSTFIPPKEDVFCFAMTTTDADVGIFGNFAQSNLLIGFDVDGEQVSFKQTDCTEQE